MEVSVIWMYHFFQSIQVYQSCANVLISGPKVNIGTVGALRISLTYYNRPISSRTYSFGGTFITDDLV